jgi:hypothetical protein
MRIRGYICVLSLALLLPSLARAADRTVYVLQFPPDQVVSLNLYRTGVVERMEGSAEVRHRFKKTKERTTSVEIFMKGAPPPSDVKPEFQAYIAWAVDAKGGFTRLGLFPNKGNLKAETELQSFGIVISAEVDPEATAPKGKFVLESEFPVKKNSFFGMTKVVYTHDQ